MDIDQIIKTNYNNLLILQIEEQEIKNDILKKLYKNGILVNYPIIKYNELQYNYNNIVNNNKIPKSPPMGMYN